MAETDTTSSEAATGPDLTKGPASVQLVHSDTTTTLTVREDMVDNYLAEGWRVKAANAPAGNASLAEWQEYARTKGFTDADLEGKKRDELIAALA